MGGIMSRPSAPAPAPAPAPVPEPVVDTTVTQAQKELAARRRARRINQRALLGGGMVGGDQTEQSTLGVG